MKTMTVIFVLALITIAFEIYSDAALTCADVSHTSSPGPRDGRRRPCAQARLSSGIREFLIRRRMVA
jgi:hypothetical protein